MKPCGRAKRLVMARVRGMILVDGLIAILIFSIGILSVVALQALGIRYTSDARYRVAAAIYADRLLAQMWASAAQPSALQAFATGGEAYAAWQSAVAAELPGADAAPPTVTFNGAEVTIVVSWKMPNENVPHAYTTTSQIVP